MLLSNVLKGIKYQQHYFKDREIVTITDDSRDVQQNALFVAIRGLILDSHSFIRQAIQSGAKAIVYDRITDDIKSLITKNRKALFIKVSDSRKALALISASWYGNPDKKLKIIGITGTKGKTTTCEFLYEILKSAGKKVGLISTISARFQGKEIDTGYHTTSPGASDLHNYLKQMANAGCEYVILETTSHALTQSRYYGIEFFMSCVTNITPEHLDYHKTYQEYVKAKGLIFKQTNGPIFLNKYDPSLKMLLSFKPERTNIVDYKELDIPSGFSDVFPGTYNLENLAMAYSLAKEIVDVKLIDVVGQIKPIKGRFERVIGNAGDCIVIIDFAHTPESLKNVLKVARTKTSGRVILVFGCAGLRDPRKREPMGKIAKKLADIVVITSEDPRTENLEDMNKAIVKGVEKSGGVLNKDCYVVLDRQEAINFAILNVAEPKDLVLITGKGHEKSMCFGDKEIPWSDEKAVFESLKAKK